MRAGDLEFTQLKDYKAQAVVEVIIQAESLVDAVGKAEMYLSLHCSEVKLITSVSEMESK